MLGHAREAWVVAFPVAGLAALYLYGYSQRPGPPPRIPAPAEPEAEEPFDDPVEAADRADSGASAPPEGNEGVTPPTPAEGESVIAQETELDPGGDFDDPVAEADRLDREPRSEAPGPPDDASG